MVASTGFVQFLLTGFRKSAYKSAILLHSVPQTKVTRRQRRHDYILRPDQTSEVRKLVIACWGFKPGLKHHLVGREPFHDLSTDDDPSCYGHAEQEHFHELVPLCFTVIFIATLIS